jgi:hypothetical protein
MWRRIFSFSRLQAHRDWPSNDLFFLWFSTDSNEIFFPLHFYEKNDNFSKFYDAFVSHFIYNKTRKKITLNVFVLFLNILQRCGAVVFFVVSLWLPKNWAKRFVDCDKRCFIHIIFWLSICYCCFVICGCVKFCRNDLWWRLA